MMDRTIRDVAILIAVASIIFLSNLGGTRLWDGEEVLTAGCASEMLATGDWITPVFNSQIQTSKPALSYWLITLSSILFGTSEFAARFPSVVLGLGTCLLTYAVGRQLFGRTAALWSSVILSTTMLMGSISRSATTDAAVTFFSTLAVALYVFASPRNPRSAHEKQLAMPSYDFPAGMLIPCAIYSTIGAILLTQGPLAACLPLAVIFLFLAIRRLPALEHQDASARRQLLTDITRIFAPRHVASTLKQMRPLLGTLVVAVIALPWYLLVGVRTHGVWPSGFWAIASPAAFSSLPLTLLAGFFPWSIFFLPTALAAFRAMRRNDMSSRSIALTLCWSAVSAIAFLFANNQHAGDLAPCFPALALLTGFYVDRCASGLIPLTPVWRRIEFGTLILVGMFAGIMLSFGGPSMLDGEKQLCWLALIPIIGGACSLWFAETGRQLFACRWIASTAIIFSFAIFVLAPERVDRHRHLETLLTTIHSGPGEAETEIAALSPGERSWAYYLKQPIRQLTTQQEALQYLQEKLSSGKQRIIITTARRMLQEDAISPLSSYVVQRIPDVLMQDEIVVLKPTPASVQSAQIENPYHIQ